MKKFLVAAVMILVSTATFAQNEVGQLTIQPKVGLNIADFQNADGSNVRCGVAVGAEFEYGITDMFSLSVGALYSMQGAKDKDNGVTSTIKADYINVPIMANVYVMKGLAVKLGIQPGFNINSELSLSGSGTTVSTVPDAKTIDFSIPIGLSYQYENLVFDARYNYGLNDVFDNVDFKNSVFQITVGYKFNL